MDKRIINYIERLPAISPMATECLAALSVADVHIGDVVRVLGRDPALAAHVLRLANSPFYGCASRVETVHQACLVLGTRTLRQTIQAAAVLSALDDGSHGAVMQRWKHAAASARAARALAAAAGLDPDVAATAGLLHDIGRILLGRCCAEEYRVLTVRARREMIPLRDAEFEVLGTDHAMIGGLLGARWHLPAAMTAAIAHHHAPDLDVPEPLVDAVHLANVLAHALDQDDEEEVVPLISEPAWQRLGLTSEKVTKMFPDIMSEHE
jgi:putative nucleotidyltransferase with HDIG domain